MTSEKNSKNSLKQWVSKIKRYELELPRLYEKLEYLKVRSIGYNSPSFEPRLSSGGSSNYKGIDYWLEKIDDCERKIKYRIEQINKYNIFLDRLSEETKDIFLKYYYFEISVTKIANEYVVKRHSLYYLFNKLDRIYKKNNS